MDKLAKEAYEQFQAQTQAVMTLPYEELPPHYKAAWAAVVKLIREGLRRR